MLVHGHYQKGLSHPLNVPGHPVILTLASNSVQIASMIHGTEDTIYPEGSSMSIQFLLGKFGFLP